MALSIFDPNLSATSQNQAFYLLVVQLIAAGWTPVDGSDGHTYGVGLAWNAPAVVLTAGAWQRLQAGDGARQLCFGVGDPLTRECVICYGPTAGTGPVITPGDATNFPEVVGGWRNIVGAGGPPTLTSQFSAPYSMRLAIGCASAAGAGDGAFYMVAAPQGGGVPWQTLLTFEPVAFPDPADPDPYVWRAFGYDGGGYQPVDSSAGSINAISSVGGFRGQGGTPGAGGFGGFGGLVMWQQKWPYSGSFKMFPASVANPGDHEGPGPNPFSGRYDHAPIPIAGSRMAHPSGFGNSGWKGVSTLYRWLGAALGQATPAVLEIPGVGGGPATARIASGAVSLEWPNPAVPWAP